MASEYPLLDILKDIRTLVNEAFDALDDEELDEPGTLTVMGALDRVHDEVTDIISELS